MNQIDPSRTALLRNTAVQTVNKHYRTVITTLREYLVNYYPGKFMPEEVPVVIENFHTYFLQLLNKNLVPDKRLSKIFRDSYVKGVTRAVHSLKSKELINSSPEFARGVESAYIRTLTLNDQIDNLTNLAFKSLDDVNRTVVTRTAAGVYVGVKSDYSQKEVYEIIRAHIQNIAVPRARTVVRTEIVRSQACGLLDAFDQMGVSTVAVDTEETNANQSGMYSSCNLCSHLQNKVFDLKDAYSLIPAHPNCRCSFSPVDTDGVKLPVMLNDVIEEDE